MRKLISFSLFAGIVIVALAAKSANAQMVVRARVAAAPVMGRPFCRRARYSVIAVRPHRVSVPIGYYRAHPGIRTRRIF